MERWEDQSLVEKMDKKNIQQYNKYSGIYDIYLWYYFRLYSEVVKESFLEEVIPKLNIKTQLGINQVKNGQ